MSKHRRKDAATSSENKISHRWRERAWLALNMLSESKTRPVRRPAGCIASLDDWLHYEQAHKQGGRRWLHRMVRSSCVHMLGSYRTSGEQEP